ncbi:MAG: LpxI family protein [Alphaproteobacteria bacterium]|nr:LpxI family protein [Alphaproteobacteria bacterium]
MRIGLLAGSGHIPSQVLQGLLAHNHDVFPIMLGRASPVLEKSISIPIDRPGRLFSYLRRHHIKHVILVGSLERPLIRDLRPDLYGLRILPRIARALRQGDDALLREVASILENEGVSCLSVLDMVPELSLEAGHWGVLSARHLEDIEKGFQALAVTSSLDMGQGCVVRDGILLAMEAIEGTDQMLKNICALPPQRSRRDPQGSRSGVLVKAPKIQQDMRFDIPTIGPQTIKLTAEAGLAGIAVVAKNFLLASPENSMQLLRDHKMFLLSKEIF